MLRCDDLLIALAVSPVVVVVTFPVGVAPAISDDVDIAALRRRYRVRSC
jgi:hypothetical protein